MKNTKKELYFCQSITDCSSRYKNIRGGIRACRTTHKSHGYTATQWCEINVLGMQSLMERKDDTHSNDDSTRYKNHRFCTRGGLSHHLFPQTMEVENGSVYYKGGSLNSGWSMYPNDIAIWRAYRVLLCKTDSQENPVEQWKFGHEYSGNGSLRLKTFSSFCLFDNADPLSPLFYIHPTPTHTFRPTDVQTSASLLSLIYIYTDKYYNLLLWLLCLKSAYKSNIHERVVLLFYTFSISFTRWYFWNLQERPKDGNY